MFNFLLIRTYSRVGRVSLYAGAPLGILYLASIIYLSPIIGFGLCFSAVVCGQILLSALFDHIAFFGIPRNEMTWKKAIVIVFAIVGLVMLVSC
jgi:uncharacterized membrane protein YdcZ (DUF606 family)